MYLNKAMIFGNLTRDPEMKALPSGMQVCSFSVATNRNYTDRDGKKQESTDYHNVVAFGKQAEVISKYISKGRGIYVEGRMQTRSWDKDGQKQYRTEIIMDRFEFGPSTGSGSAPAQSGSSNVAPAQNNQGAPVLPDYPEEDINPEDIPF
jgi:single-strand DNA-binding protein